MAFSTQQFTSPKTNPVTAKCVFQHTANSRGFQSVHPLRIAHFARGRSTTNNNNLSCQAVASTATPVATSDTRAPSSAAAATATSVWPCRSGHIVSVLQTATDGGAHSLQIIVQGLEEGETAQLLWGVYRSSPHAWQHPDSIDIPGSRIDETTGTMMSPMDAAVDATSQSISVDLPPGLAPITFAFLVAIEPSTTSTTKKKKRKIVAPLQGRHFSALIGVNAGLPTPLGPSIISTPSSLSSSTSSPGKKKKTTTTTTTTSGQNDTTASVNFAVRCRGGTTVSLVLIQPPSAQNQEWTIVELALDPSLNRTGDTWHIAVPKLRNLDAMCYGWRLDGDVSWDSGFRVQPDKILLDPMAPALVHLPLEPVPPVPLSSVELADGTHVIVASAVACGRRLYTAPKNLTTNTSTASSSSSVVASLPLRRPLENTRVLEIDVRSFAQGPKVTHPGTFLGVAQRVDHILAVGANTVVLSPCNATMKTSFGQSTSPSHAAALSFIAPDPALSTDPSSPAAAHAELREMVNALHAAGIEVLCTFDLTLTADGVDSHPTTVSLRGLDNAAYFRPNGVLNCGHPAVQDLIQKALKFWALSFGVDGFCFLNAENAAQDVDGVVVDAPALAESLCYDPILSGLKLIAAPSNSELLPRSGARGFPHWGLWMQRNATFTRDISAFFLEPSTPLALESIAAKITGSVDIFGPVSALGGDDSLPGNLATPRRPSFSFNAATPAVSGAPSVISVATEAVAVATAALMASPIGGSIPSAVTITKSVLLATLLSQGVPIVNHADVADVEVARFVGIVTRLRRKLAHLLLPPKFDTPRALTWHTVYGGEPAWQPGQPGEGAMPPMPLSHVPDGLGYLAFSVVDADGSAVYVGLNPYPTLVNATLPSPPAGHTWLRAVDSGLAAPLDAAIGLKQREHISPDLFGFYIDDLPSEIESGGDGGDFPTLSSLRVPPLLHADDLAIVAMTIESFQMQLDTISVYAA